MKLKICFFALTVMVALFCSQAFGLYAPNRSEKSSSYQPDRIIVKFKSPEKLSRSGGSGKALATGIGSVDRIIEQYKIEKMDPLFSSRQMVESSKAFSGVQIMTVPKGSDAGDIARALADDPEVEYAEPDYMAEFYGAPDDPLYLYQWNLHNVGQEHFKVKRIPGNNNDSLIMTTGVDGADIDADEVFEVPPDGTRTAVAAILDTGVDMKHPDLAANIWVNPREIPDNGLDDDNNGYVDDINGWDFAGSTEDFTHGDNDPTDEHGHGTHCAGIVAAVTNNMEGVAGVAVDCKIMALKIDPLPLASIIAEGIIYAADNGADVINMSFGLAYPSDLIGEAFVYARAKGVVLCAASGNDGREQYNYPAESPLTIAVAATNDSDLVTTFSTFADIIDVAAPGYSVLSLRASHTDMYAESNEAGTHIVDSIYYLASGTSMACPHVVGEAAYIRSVSPGLNVDKIEEIIKGTAKDIVDPYGIGWNLPGWDKYSGYGRIDLKQALDQTPRATAEITYPYRNEVVSGTIDVVGLAETHGQSFWNIEYGEGANPTVWYPIADGEIPGKIEPNAIWHTEGLNGVYTIRMRVGSFNTSDVTVFVVNDIAARIDSPESNGVVGTLTGVIGAAYCQDYSYASLESLVDTSGAVWEEVALLTQPVFDDNMAYWLLYDNTENVYQLKLSVFSHAGLVRADTVLVRHRSIFATDRAWKVSLPGRPAITPTYADLDGDGVNEIIVGTELGIKVFNLDGTAKTEGIPDFPDNNFIIPAAVGNLDNDGRDDIVLMGVDPPFIYGYPSSAPPFVNHLGMYPTVGYFSGNTEHMFPKVFLKDIDGDHRDEIHVVMPDNTTPTALLFDSDGTLRHRFEHVMEYQPADLNGDGMDELYTMPRYYGLLRQVDPVTGSTVDSLIISDNGSAFDCRGLTAVDIDNDGKTELIVMGLYRDLGHYLYAFDDGLRLKDGWPHDMGMNDFIAPTVPVFGDIDNDGNMEYASGYFDLDYSYMFVWNIDGSSFLPGSPNGFFAKTPQISLMNMPDIVDIDGDGSSDILACANNDAFLTFRVHRVYAWNNKADVIRDFPIVSAAGIETSYYRFVPMLGDIDKDGTADMILTSADMSLEFVSFPGVPYNPCKAFAPAWRYDRSFSGTLPEIPCVPTGSDEDVPVVPQDFVLKQNYPNPFNPTTVINYTLPSRSDVEIAVYDILGRRVRTLLDETQAAGPHEVSWNGTDGAGHPVATGVYFYRLQAGDMIETRKMMLLK